MIKKQIYPKTKRFKLKNRLITITEKLDGTNITIFKKDGQLMVASRHYIFSMDDFNDKDDGSNKDITIKGLIGWIREHKDELEKELHENSCICGEWLGQGRLKYPNADKRFYMFAKANITDELTLKNIKYEHDKFIYPFISKIIPDFIGIVPLVAYLEDVSIDKLDKLYEDYTKKVNRDVEGFIINRQDYITKYVRMKNGKLEDHKE